jgi:hypothetical protein
VLPIMPTGNPATLNHIAQEGNNRFSCQKSVIQSGSPFAWQVHVLTNCTLNETLIQRGTVWISVVLLFPSNRSSKPRLTRHIEISAAKPKATIAMIDAKANAQNRFSFGIVVIRLRIDFMHL